MKEYTTKSGITFKESELKTNKNPYENADGSWKTDQLKEWYAWDEAKRRYDFDNMTAAEQERYLAAQRRFGKRAKAEAGE